MLRLILIALCLLPALLSPGSVDFYPAGMPAQPLMQTPPGGEREEQALQFLEQLVQGQYDQAVQRFDEPMIAVLPAPRLQALWQEITTNYGPYQSVVEIQSQPAQTQAFVAVNLHVQFERALVNLRVVFNESGQISGLFYSPLEATGSVSPGFSLALAFSAAFAILFPILLAIFVHRRLAVPWRFFFYGVGIFILFQLISRIPIISLIEGAFGAQLRSSTPVLVLWLFILSLSAGLFEEIGRYVGYRWIMNRDPKSWKIGIMYGLGHGGIESMILVGLNNLVSLGTILLFPLVADSLFPQQRGALTQQIAMMLGAPDWLPLLAAWERLWSILFHVALSVMVLQVFRRGQIGWLWLSVAIHTAANLLVAGLPFLIGLPTQSAQLLSAGLVFVVGIFAVWIIWRLRDPQELPEPV